MNKQLFYIITIFVICIISVTRVKGQEEIYGCKPYKEYGCSTDEECCTNNCLFTSIFRTGTCELKAGTFDKINSLGSQKNITVVDSPKGEYGICVYIKENNAIIRDFYFDKYKIHAANSMLPFNSKFGLYANNSYVEVTITEDDSRTSKADHQGITFLSNEAATVLGITKNGTTISCKILDTYTERGIIVTYIGNILFFVLTISPAVGIIAAAGNIILKLF